MSDRTALVIAILIVGLIIADFALNSGTALLFLAKKFEAFVNWLAIWR